MLFKGNGLALAPNNRGDPGSPPTLSGPSRARLYRREALWTAASTKLPTGVEPRTGCLLATHKSSETRSSATHVFHIIWLLTARPSRWPVPLQSLHFNGTRRLHVVYSMDLHNEYPCDKGGTRRRNRSWATRRPPASPHLPARSREAARVGLRHRRQGRGPQKFRAIPHQSGLRCEGRPT